MKIIPFPRNKLRMYWVASENDPILNLKVIKTFSQTDTLGCLASIFWRVYQISLLE